MASVGKIPSRRAWQPTLVFLPAESHRCRCLVRCSPWGPKESDMTEQLTPPPSLPHDKFRKSRASCCPAWPHLCLGGCWGATLSV